MQGRPAQRQQAEGGRSTRETTASVEQGSSGSGGHQVRLAGCPSDAKTHRVKGKGLLNCPVRFDQKAPNADQSRHAQQKLLRPIEQKELKEDRDMRDQQPVQTRIVKRILPNQPGAQKLARRYGEALVCVRYRHNANGTWRYTTVELVVDQAPVMSKRADAVIVSVYIGYDEAAMQRKAREGGAQWDLRDKVWRMPRKLARRLGLIARIRPE